MENHSGALVRSENLTIRYPRATAAAVENVSLDVRRGDRLLLLGPSGCGKSTLLFAMAGIIPDQVSATIDGSLVRSTARIAVVLQNPEAQMIAPTVERELAFSLENSGLPAAGIMERIDHALDDFGIRDLRHRSPSTLSGGECQKVSLAAAVAGEPEILFLDEPTAFLDPRSTRSFFGLLERVDRSITIVIVEHKIEFVRDFVDRYARMDRPNGSSSSIVETGVISDSRAKDSLSALYWFTGFEERPERPPSLYQHSSAAVPLLEVERLRHVYPPTTVALRDVSLSVSRGETIVVMGPNGSGKSTLLDRIAALSGGKERAAREIAGKGIVGKNRKRAAPIRILGRDVRKIPRRTLYSLLYLIPQNPEHLFLTDTVGEELSVQASDGKAIAEVTGRFRLTGLESRNPYSLSEGEKRRLNLCCAQLDPRDLLLLDEPTYGLDASAIAALVDLLALFRRSGRTLLIVTHSAELAHLVADRLVILDRGTVLFAGSPGELLHAPDTSLREFLPYWAKVQAKVGREGGGES